MNIFYRYSSACVLLMFASLPVSSAEVVSENLVFLKEDGRSYLLQRSMRTSSEKYHFHVDKQVGLEDFSYIDPNEYEWDDSSDPASSLLKFARGSFTVMYPGDYGTRVSIDDNGVYTLNTWDGTVRDNDRFGMWNQPGDFSRFVQAWVIPEVFTVLDYESNREGEWVERNNTLTFFATDVNDLTFTVRYQLVDKDADGVADRDDRCPDTPAGVAVNSTGCERDTDGDGVLDSMDRCPGTLAGVVVGAQGCEPDDDSDGVVNRLDQCAATPPGAVVDASGCELDADGDGVVDRLDNCPDSVAGANVDCNGCELDCDEDGVPNGADECPRTPAGASVNAQGCEQDADADRDGVNDGADLCADTPAGVEVDVTGCEIAKPITLRGVNFQFDSDQLTRESIVILGGVATTLLAHPDLRLEVAGHTDAAGDDAFNLDLSQRRSETVRAFLVERGINPEHLQAQGYGEQRPVADNTTAEGRAANRRVELIRIGE